MRWAMLALAIVLEVTGTLSMRASEGFSRLGFTMLTVAGYLGAFTLLGLVLKHGLPVGVVYGIWAGAGVNYTRFVGIRSSLA